MNGKDLLSSCNGANIETIGNMIIETFNKFNIKNKLKNKIDNETDNKINDEMNSNNIKES